MNTLFPYEIKPVSVSDDAVLGADEINALRIIAERIRIEVIDSTFCAKSGHPGGSLSIADIVAYLYFARMNVSCEQKDDPMRDRFVLSKGHCAPALYAALALRGYFPMEELKFLRKTGNFLHIFGTFGQ